MALKSKAEAREAYLEYKEHRGDDTMSMRGYLFALASFIAFGIALAAFTASHTYNMKPNGWWIVAYFAITIPGVIISGMSRNWIVSLIGYVMIIIPTGAIVGPYVKLFEISSVLNVLMLTIAATIVIGFVGAIWPKSVEHWFGFLFAGLVILLLADLSPIILKFFGMKPALHQPTVDWFAIGLFSLLIFYDMNQAMRMPPNLNNAVYNAVAMYLNMINLFVRLLARTGQLAPEVASTVGDVVGEAL